MWAASENHARCGSRARRGGRGRQRAIDAARRAGARVPAQRRPELAVPARRLDRADVRGARRRDRRGARAGRARRQPERDGAAADRHAAQAAKRSLRRSRRTSARPRWSSRSSTSHYDLAAVLLEKGADPNVVDLRRHGRALRRRRHEQPAVGRRAGRRRFFIDKLDGVDLVKLLLAQGRESERAPQAASR